MKCSFCNAESKEGESRCEECGQLLLAPPSEPAKDHGFQGIFEKTDGSGPQPISEAEQHVKAAQIAQEALTNIHEAKGLGAETAEAEMTLERARESMREKQFMVAIAQAQEALKQLEQAKDTQKKRMEAVNCAQEVLRVITEAKKFKMNTSEAERIFNDAKACMAQKKFDETMDLIRKAQSALEDAKTYQKVMANAREVRVKIEEVRGYGLDVTMPEKTFKLAKPAIEEKKYKEALELVERAREEVAKIIIRRQLIQLEVVKEEPETLKKAQGVFVLDEDVGDDEASIGSTKATEDKPYSQAYKNREKEVQKLERIALEYSRLKADFDNYRRNTEDRMANTRDQAYMDLIGSLLDVLDNFERAFKAYDKDKTCNLDGFMTGMMNVHKQMMDILKDMEVNPIDTKGEKFDPFMHEVVSTMSNKDIADDAIIEVALKGYTYKDKVLRPAKVVLNKKPE